MEELKEADIKEARRKLEELKRHVDKLEGDFYQNKNSKEIKTESNDSKDYSKSDKKKSVKILVILILVILVIDIISVIAYYRPDFSSVFKFKPKTDAASDNTSSNDVGTGKCEDGTLEGKCSKKQPYYCYQGQLVKKASECGCPVGWVKDFQGCKVK